MTKKTQKPQRYLNCLVDWDSKQVQKDASGKITIKGFANTSDKDRVGDVVLPSAFTKTLDGYMENAVVLFRHNWDKVIGKCIKAEVQDEGLYVECEISGAKDVDDVRTKIAEGSLKTFSIGYNELDADYDEGSGCNIVKELELLEISVVTIPCNPKAKFTTEVTQKDNEEEVENKSGVVEGFFDYLADALKGLTSTEDIDGEFLSEIHNIFTSKSKSKSAPCDDEEETEEDDEEKGGPGSGRHGEGGGAKPAGDAPGANGRDTEGHAESAAKAEKVSDHADQVLDKGSKLIAKIKDPSTKKQLQAQHDSVSKDSSDHYDAMKAFTNKPSAKTKAGLDKATAKLAKSAKEYGKQVKEMTTYYRDTKPDGLHKD